MTDNIETVYFHDSVVVKHLDNMNSVLYVDAKRKQRYYGETAWSDAERDAYDISVKRMYQK